ncbi:hypothetical protein Tco_0467849 [Tanacetum coccineum]
MPIGRLSPTYFIDLSCNSKIIIRRDETVQSFCGLKLSYIGIPDRGTSSVPTKEGRSLKRKSIIDATNHPFSHASTRASGIEVSYHNLGAPTYECRGCNATMWYEERNNKGNMAANLTSSLCCQQGKVLLPHFNETSEPLKRLLDYSQSATS